MGAKELKAAILQEAISGRLVPQIASEGNARDLLEEIRKLRIENGKLKSKKSSLIEPVEINVDEIPFEIPESWCWCSLEKFMPLFEQYGRRKRNWQIFC